MSDPAAPDSGVGAELGEGGDLGAGGATAAEPTGDGAADEAALLAAQMEAARAEGRGLITGQGIMWLTLGAILVMFGGIFGFAWCAFMP